MFLEHDNVLYNLSLYKHIGKVESSNRFYIVLVDDKDERLDIYYTSAQALNAAWNNIRVNLLKEKQIVLEAQEYE